MLIRTGMNVFGRERKPEEERILFERPGFKKPPPLSGAREMCEERSAGWSRAAKGGGAGLEVRGQITADRWGGRGSKESAERGHDNSAMLESRDLVWISG